MSNLRCQIFGHKRASRPSSYWHHRSAQMRPCYRWSCSRCHTGDPDCWTPGWTEQLSMWWDDVRFRIPRWFAAPAPKDPSDADIPF